MGWDGTVKATSKQKHHLSPSIDIATCSARLLRPQQPSGCLPQPACLTLSLAPCLPTYSAYLGRQVTQGLPTEPIRYESAYLQVPSTRAHHSHLGIQVVKKGRNRNRSPSAVGSVP
jgi:hypothetical protein